MEETRKATRNQRMDLYRGAAIYGVVLIHVLFPGKFGEAVRALARFAVPLFFLTAGYFSLNASPEALARRSVRALKQLLLSCLPYLLLGLWLAAGREESPLKWLLSLFSRAALMEFAAFHSVPLPYAWQLWFLGALFTVYLWWWAVSEGFVRADRPIPYDVFAIAALVLLAIHLILGEGLTLLLEIQVDNRVLRNALLDGLPFFLLGCWCASRRKQLRELAVPWHFVILGGGALSLLESILAGRQELYLGTLVMLAGIMGRCLRRRRNTGREPGIPWQHLILSGAVIALIELILTKGRQIYLGPLVLLVGVVGVCLYTFPEVWESLSEALQYCGRELTLYIFALHMVILALIRELPFLAWLNGLEWLMPIAVAVLSTLAALGMVRLREKMYPEGRF